VKTHLEIDSVSPKNECILQVKKHCMAVSYDIKQTGTFLQSKGDFKITELISGSGM